MDTQIEVIFNQILVSCLEQKASDLFLFPGQKPYIRAEGVVRDLNKAQIVAANFIEGILARLLTQEQQEILKKQKQLVFSRELGKNHRAKINVFRQNNLSAIAIKLFSNQIISLEQLKLPKLVTEMASLNKGLIIISGPRDSGRSNLMAAMVDYINKNKSVHIATIEKPIEYLFMNGKSLVEQREVSRDVVSFQDGINSIDDRSVDVLVSSGIEKPDQVFDLLKICQKSILVFLLMEADNSSSVIQQVLEGVEPSKHGLIKNLLADNLGGIICTRLVPKIGGGRILALEVLNGSPMLKNLIREGRALQLKNIFQVAEKELSISLDRFLADLVKSGEVNIEEALKQATDPENLKSMTNLN
ncbi:MAG: ATPase, T2SS/T4P/T4SS family [Patescibacteria group bacterium]|nr:ATPase, T2SS/T4P/T4SS family [Patescibacteria group bacterium]MDD5121179.1 ATPase, T2SS/T4P/T4SS family [Patescibacteria group bacterium]MDD5222011.1 ATPase, T2SS/T4P/T4SS family [Patescibacteria group bacterium]MDD5395902.1 ATPase, T2SS/T4P/T4SS family [Patescibacteria group bacterium]